MAVNRATPLNVTCSVCGYDVVAGEEGFVSEKPGGVAKKAFFARILGGCWFRS